MVKPTKHAKIIGFPSEVSLSSGRIESLNEVRKRGCYDFILDYQELRPTSSRLSSEGEKVFEEVEGYYQPQRLRFLDVQLIKRTGLYEELDSLPPNHTSRSLHGALHWRPPNNRTSLYLLFNSGDEPGSYLFSARKSKIEVRTGKTIDVAFRRDWSPAPSLPLGLVPMPNQLHERYGGDPITIRLGKRTYHKRLFIGGLSSQPEHRPDVNAVLNLGEEPSRWAIASNSHSADRWISKGEGNDGMCLNEIIEEAQWALERLRKGQKVLVHCVAGFNRSVTICCAILMFMEGLRAEAALARVREHHPWALPDSHHWLILRWLTQQLIAQS